jgi:predicted enzyme related to lactoylglutathione lyase
VLGLDRTEASSFANAYDASGTQLRVTRVEEPLRAPYTVLGWRVKDISAELERISSQGVEAKRYPNLEQDASGVWTSPGGSQIAWFEDPDGNVLSFQQAG